MASGEDRAGDIPQRDPAAAGARGGVAQRDGVAVREERVAVGERLLLIDFERAAYRGRPLPEPERLRLVAKIDRIPALSRADRLRFVRGYVDAHEADRRRFKEIVRELRRLADEKKASDAEKEARRRAEAPTSAML